MTGWRLGYLAMPGDDGLALAKATAKLQGQINTAVTSFCLPAARAALAEGAPHVERMRQAFAERGKLIHDKLAAMPSVNCPTPTGAFYVFPDVSAHLGKTTPSGKKIDSVVDLATALLEEASSPASPARTSAAAATAASASPSPAPPTPSKKA